MSCWHGEPGCEICRMAANDIAGIHVDTTITPHSTWMGIYVNALDLKSARAIIQRLHFMGYNISKAK